MKPVAFLKLAGTVACVAFALNANAQTNEQTSNPSAASNAAMSSSSLKMKMDNGAITTKVKAELLAKKGLTSTHIHVKTRGSTVTLTGHVPTAEQKQLAKDTAVSVDGVSSVRNRLKVVAE